MNVRYYIDSQGRTIIEASTGFDPGDQRARVYAPDGYVFDLNFKWPDGGTKSFAIEDEDKSEHFIEVYPNGYSGSVDIALEVKYSALGASTGWKEKEKYTLNYPINKNQYTAPSVDSITFSPTETVLSTPSLYVKTKNGIKVSEIQSSAKYGASITQVKWYIDGDPARYDVGASSEKFGTYGQVPLSVEVTDTRGFTTVHKQNITVYDYAPPRVSPVEGSKDIKAERSGANIAFSLGKRYSDVGGHNKCKLAYSLRAIFETNWGDAVTLLDENSPSNDFAGEEDENLNDRTIYYVEVVAKDSFGGIGRVVLDIPTDEVFIHKSANLNSIGLGGPTSLENALEVFFETHLYNVSQLMLTSPGGKSFLLTIDDDGVISTKDVSPTTL